MNTKVHTTTVNEYDADNRLSKATITSNGSGESGSSTTFTQENLYNGDGQRIQKTEGANETNYFYQGGVVSYTTEGSADTKAIQNLLGVEGNVIAAEENVPADFFDVNVISTSFDGDVLSANVRVKTIYDGEVIVNV